MKKLYVIENSDGYEALYIDDWIKGEARPLNEGRERVLYFLELCKLYGTEMEMIRFGYTDEDDE